MNKANETDLQVLDVTGLSCPIPVLRTRRILDDLKTGERLQVRASDPASVHDMPAFCKMAGHILHMAKQDEGTYIFEIEKAATPPRANDNVIPLRNTS